MLYLAIMVIIVFISMFVNGIQMFRNGKLIKKLAKSEEELKTLLEKPVKEVY